MCSGAVPMYAPLLTMFFLFNGCKSDEKTASTTSENHATTPEELAQLFVKGRSDLAAIKSILPSEKGLKELMNCDGKNPHLAWVKRANDSLEEGIKEMSDGQFTFVASMVKDKKLFKKGEKN